MAAKFFDDQYFNNNYYAKVGGITAEEINHLEVEFVFMCNFTLYVSTETYAMYYQELTNHALNPNNTCSCAKINVPPLQLPPEIMKDIERIYEQQDQEYQDTDNYMSPEEQHQQQHPQQHPLQQQGYAHDKQQGYHNNNALQVNSDIPIYDDEVSPNSYEHAPNLESSTDEHGDEDYNDDMQVMDDDDRDGNGNGNGNGNGMAGAYNNRQKMHHYADTNNSLQSRFPHLMKSSHSRSQTDLLGFANKQQQQYANQQQYGQYNPYIQYPQQQQQQYDTQAYPVQYPQKAASQQPYDRAIVQPAPFKPPPPQLQQQSQGQGQGQGQGFPQSFNGNGHTPRPAFAKPPAHRQQSSMPSYPSLAKQPQPQMVAPIPINQTQSQGHHFGRTSSTPNLLQLQYTPGRGFRQY